MPILLMKCFKVFVAVQFQVDTESHFSGADCKKVIVLIKEQL